MDQLVAAPGPQTEIDPHIESRLGSTGRLIRWWAAIYATLAFASTQFDQLEPFFLDGPDFLRALPVTAALPLAVLAIGALMAADSRRATRGETWRRVGSVLCGLIAAYGLYIVAVFAISFPDWWPMFLESAPLPSLWVGIILLVLGFIRELFGAGSLFGVQILDKVTEGGWYIPNGMMLLPPSAFFLIGFIIWAIRAAKPEQVEEDQFKMSAHTRTSEAF